MISTGKIVKSDVVRSGLISLIDKKKNTFHGGISEIVRREFDLISQAREAGASWTEIVDALDFSGKEAGFALAFWRERRRREKREKEVMPEKREDVMPDAKAKTQKESAPFRAEDKGKNGRIGPPRPIGRGRLDLGENIPDDEL